MSSNEEEGREENNKSKNSMLISLTIILIVFVGFLYYQKAFPGQLMNFGKKYLEIKDLDKALKIFRYASNIKPNDIEPIYYEVLTLAKMPPTYNNQKRLYEISQYDDCDEASTLADNVLVNIRMQIDRQAGTNYIDNVLFEDNLIRWNNTHPITYSIVSNSSISKDFESVTDKAFKQWSSATNGEFSFKKITGNANIIIHIVYTLPDDKLYTTRDSSAVTIANITNDKLNNMDIFVKSTDDRGYQFPNDKLYYLMLHQIGHALGIGGHSILKNDVMYYDGDLISDNMIPKNISQRDLNTLNLLYRMVPDIINTNIDSNIKNNLLYHEIITAYPGENYAIETQRTLQELQKDKKNVEKWVDLAESYAVNRQYQRANYILESILPLVSSQKENLFAIYFNMSLNYYRMKDYLLAEKYILLAENIQKDKETKTIKAFINVKTKNINQAKAQLILLKKENPEDIEISLKLAEIYYKEKNIKESKKIIADLIKSNPEARHDKRILKYK